MNEAETVARRWFEEVWNQRKEDRIFELMSDHCVGRAAAGETRSAREWQEKSYRPLIAAIPDARVVIDGVIAAGDEAVVRWQVKGTHRGEGLGVPPTGKAVHVYGLTWMRVHAGQIVEGLDGWDFGSLLMQLGA